VLYDQGNYRDAIDYIKWAYQGSQSCAPTDFHHFFVKQEMSLNALGLCYEKLGLHDSALMYYQKTIDFIESHFRAEFPDSDFPQVAKGVVYGNMGNVEIAIGKHEQAEAHLIESISVNSQRGREQADATLTQIKLANLYLTQNRLKSCDSLIQIIQEYVEGNTLLEAKTRLYLLKRQYFLALANYKEAFASFLVYQHLTDSLSQITKELTHTDVKMALLELSRKEELDALRETEEDKNLFIGAALILALALGIIIYLIRRNLVVSKANVEKLNTLNYKIVERNDNLRLAMENLESSQEEMQHVLGVVAHDLRTPIGSIVSLSEVIGFDEGLNSETKELVEMIGKLGKDSIGLMEGILNMQLVNGNFESEPLNLLDLVHYCTGVMKHSAKEKGQKIEVEGANITIHGSRDMLWRVIINLLSNAIKFSQSGGTILIQINDTKAKTILSIQDQGIGIPESMKAQVFDILTKAKREGTQGEKTHGLGLSICKRIMELHGGRIWFDSEEGRGTTFYLEFPH